MEVAVMSEPGFRSTMEDAYFLDTNFSGSGCIFGGIYDGHGGKFAAIYAAENLHKKFLKYIFEGLLPEQAFINSYHDISLDLSNQYSGCTAVNIYISEYNSKRIIYCANAGDARAILVSKNNIRQLTVDHRVYNEQERERIIKSGGLIREPYVIHQGMGLMPTRTLGDGLFKEVGVISTPDVSTYQVQDNDMVLVAACDGLFDFMLNEEVAQFVFRYGDLNTLLNKLVDEVLNQRFGTDNITIIAVRLN